MKKRKLRYDRLALVIGIGIASIAAPISLCYSLFHKEPEVEIQYFEPLPIITIEIQQKPSITLEELIAQKEEELTTEPEFIGVFRLTGYCACSKCCGDYADGITATGTIATEGRTIAVDPSKIPLGSKVMIEGLNGIFYAEDIGSAINNNRIDIFCNTHEECFNPLYNREAKIYLIKND